MLVDSLETKKNIWHEIAPESAPDFGMSERIDGGEIETTPVKPEKEFDGIPIPLTKPQPEPIKVIDPIEKSVENILEENMSEIFSELSDGDKIKFKEEGEKTAKKISILIKTAKVTFKKILKLISDWLKTIPGINKFFAEQEAKIKTDKIMKIQ
jgi:hypothetical protein